MSNEPFLRELFEGLQQHLRASLQSARSVIKHSGDKGRASELDWLTMLRTHLPNRYEVDSGTVVDSNGDLSDSIDIIIFDGQYSPLLFKRENNCYVPAESVYAVFEVKQDLSKANIEYAGEKAASVRRLARTSAAIPHAGGRYEPKQPKRILAGILALGSEWNPAMGSPLDQALGELDDDARLELGIALAAGAFQTDVDQDGSLSVLKSDADVALVSFFLGLTQALQQVGTVPAIDLAVWAEALYDQEG